MRERIEVTHLVILLTADTAFIILMVDVDVLWEFLASLLFVEGASSILRSSDGLAVNFLLRLRSARNLVPERSHLRRRLERPAEIGPVTIGCGEWVWSRLLEKSEIAVM